MKGSYAGKCNETAILRVKGCREAGEGKVCVEFSAPEKKGEKDDAPMPFGGESHASICMSKEAAKNYPVGSTVSLHCVPGADKDADEDDEDEEYPDNLQGRRSKDEDAMTARIKGYREEA